MSNSKKKNLIVFASGTGTNFLAILQEIQNNNINGRISLLISSKPEAKALDKARQYNIPTAVLQEKKFSCHSEYARTMMDLLKKHQTDYILLAGYLKMIPADIVETYRNKIINIHPALLPKFGGKGMYGIHVHEAVLQAGETETGVTIHFIDEKYDNGPVIMQQKIQVIGSESPEELQQKVLKIEYQLYPHVVKLLCEDKIKIKNNKVIIT